VDARPPDLLWLALVALAELVPQVADGPARPSYATRLALAVCYRHSDGDRGPFDHFWRQMQEAFDCQSTETAARYCRRSYLQAALRRVLRAVGIEPTVDVEQALDRAADKGRARQ
jgi:hypothetical protein